MGYKTVNKSNLPMIDYRELVPLQGNLKDLTKANYQKLLKSIEKEGFFVPAFVWFNDGVPYILDAHQRHRVLTNENIEFENSGFEIPYIEIEAIDEADAAEKLLKISSQYGTITQEGMDEFIAKYELPEAEVYGATNFDALVNYESDDNDEELDDSPYTGKIEVPIYDVKGKSLSLNDLYDKTKTKELLAQIEEADIPENIKEFLRMSAYRHTVFNFANIAEYYAETSPEIQDLMEKSALVIVDYDKAVENGFIKLSQKVAEQFKSDVE